MVIEKYYQFYNPIKINYLYVASAPCGPVPQLLMMSLRTMKPNTFPEFKSSFIGNIPMYSTECTCLMYSAEASDSSTLFRVSDGFDGSNDLNLPEQSILLSPKSFGVWMKMMDDIINGLNMLQKRNEKIGKQVYMLGEIKKKAQREELDALRQVCTLVYFI